jgi:hypothetical protein
VDNGSTMIRSLPGSNPKSVPGVGGRVVITVFFLFFFGVGTVFAWLVAREAVAGVWTWLWPKTECQIVRSSVRETDPRGRKTGDFYFDIEYQYPFNGQNYVSDRFRLRAASYQDYGKVERLVQRFQTGSRTACYVNPRQPAEAVLERGSLLFPLLIFFPLIFVGIGAIGIFSAWSPSSRTAIASRPISDRASGVRGKGLAIGIFALFTIVGLGMFYGIAVRTSLLVLRARNWPAVTCTVLSSQVRTHHGNHGSTYSVDVLYAYRVNGREYKANRYDFMGGSSSGYAGKQAITRRYPPGAQVICYVDPADPTQAVLERGLTPIMLLGLIPLLFIGAGVFGLRSMLRKSRGLSVVSFSNGAGFLSSGNVMAQVDEHTANAAVVLKAASSPPGKFLGMLCVALFWNGIVSVFLVLLFQSGKAGHFQWFLGLFLVPFVLIGLGMIVAVGYFFLSIFNPRPRITVTPGMPRLGDSVRLEWELSGRTEVLKDLQLSVTGQEEATYTRGTRTSTDRNVFADIEVTRLSSTREMVSSSAQVSIPADSMHSFSSQHNKIVWSIRVKGEIARWPDLNEEFALTVLPAREK